MKNENLTLWILITTLDNWINRVWDELLPQLKNVDEIIISHQITDENLKPESIIELGNYHKNIKYIFMYERWLSKNRNNALKYSTTDICHICDDDIDYKKWFENIIKNEYKKSNYDIITFQVENVKWEKRYNIKEKKHNMFSLLKISSIGITFKREKIITNNIIFNENFWLWTKYPIWEDNIFLKNCFDKKLRLVHSNKSIVFHDNISSWIKYENKNSIFSRIKLFKYLFWFIWGFSAIFYFTILHYKYYKDNFSVKEVFILSCKSFIKK